MAFPVVEATNTSVESSAATSHDVALPAGIQSGELLLALLGNINSVPVTPPGGWSEVADDIRLEVAKRTPASGGEGASATFTTGGSVVSAHNSYRISGQHGDVEASSSAGSEDPPSLSPAWGSADNLWIATVLAVATTSGVDVTAAPSGYSGLIKSAVVDAGGGVFFRLASAWRQNAAGSEDPGAFTVADADVGSVSYTVGVRPSAATVPAAAGRGLVRSVLLARRSLVS